jgi:hypothetical protein
LGLWDTEAGGKQVVNSFGGQQVGAAKKQVEPALYGAQAKACTLWGCGLGVERVLYSQVQLSLHPLGHQFYHNVVGGIVESKLYGVLYYGLQQQYGQHQVFRFFLHIK